MKDIIQTNNERHSSSKSWQKAISVRITGLLVVATLILVGQSLYNLSTIKELDHSITDMNRAALNLDSVARSFKTTMADARILSMEMVSAPNESAIRETQGRYNDLVSEIDQNFLDWDKRVKTITYEKERALKAYENILFAWRNYKEAASKTHHYIVRGIRVAAFISVTGQEKKHYDALQKTLNDFSLILVEKSRNVSGQAADQSQFTFVSLIVTSIVQVLILLLTMFFVYRMFSNYMRSARAYEKKIEAKEAQLRAAMSSMSDGLYTVDREMRLSLFNERFTDMTGMDKQNFEEGRSFEDILRSAAEVGSLGAGETEALVDKRLSRIRADGYNEWESTTHEGRILASRKNDMIDGGAIVIVSDVTERRHAEKELKEAFNKISSSINYASKIQQSILPKRDLLIEAFDDHFVYWEPRDVVGGDIYWSYKWGDGMLISLGDCTGHGVPGAFMTLISTGALERALLEVEVGDLSGLITKMNALLKQSLGQDTGSGLADDGLEIGICFIQPDQNQISFLGAKFDLLIVDDAHVETIKGGKRGLGYREIPDDHYYEATKINASSSASYYLTTDGAVDQKSANTGRRLGKKGFNTLLLDIHNLPMKDQANAIHDALMEHQGHAQRRDDVAVVGFKLG